MQNLLDELVSTLKNDDRLVIDGKLAKNKIVELALAMDEDFLNLLLESKPIKKHFFKDLKNMLVFDKVAFQSFVSNKQFLPDSYTAFKNKIGLTAKKEYLTESKEIVLSWPYKDCVLEGGQDKEDQKRKEVFWNETLAPDEIDRLLAPKALTNFKKYDKDGKHEVDKINLDDNLIIKGNNLLALHSLKKQYAGKVKLIYIDPPYNTGNDSFGYNDSFNHSTWLTFMKNRLEIAKTMLASDGVIFVHLDSNEVHYCKILLDEIFGRDRFINEIIWRRKQATSYGKSKFGITNDTILFYSKTDSYSFNPSYSLDDDNTKKYIKERFVYDDGDGKKYMKSPLVNSLYRPNLKYVFEGINPPKNGWLYSKKRMEDFLKAGELIIPDNPDARIYRRIFLESYKGQVVQNIWTDIPIVNPMAKEQTEFSTQKPERLLERIIKSTTNEGDLILDFQLGSATTLAVAHKLGRRYLGVEQMDYIKSISLKRMEKVISGDTSGISKSAGWEGGGSFVYCELAQDNANIIDEIEKAKTSKSLKNILDKIKNTDFISYKIKPESINNNIKEFEALSLEEQKLFLIAMLDKNQLYVNYSEIEDKSYQISDSDKKLNKQFYGEA